MTTVAYPIPSPATQPLLLIARRSALFLAVQLVLLEFLFIIALLFLLMPIAAFASPETLAALVRNVSLYFIAAVTLMKVILSLTLTLGWAREYYEIHPTEIIHKKGLLTLEETIFFLQKCPGTESVAKFLWQTLQLRHRHPLQPRPPRVLYDGQIAQPEKYCEIIERQLTPSTPEEPLIIRSGGRG